MFTYEDIQNWETIKDSIVLKPRLGAIMVDTKSQESCEYCHEDSDGYVKPIEKNGHAYIHFGMNGSCIELRANEWHGETKIDYCPMCGRKL